MAFDVLRVTVAFGEQAHDQVRRRTATDGARAERERLEARGDVGEARSRSWRSPIRGPGNA